MDQETKRNLLLYCLGAKVDETGVARLKQLSDSDWEGLVQQPSNRRIIPLLYHRLKTDDTNHVPARIASALERIYFENTLINTRRYHELSKMLEVMADNDIPIIVLKGAALAELIYRNITLRPMADIDLVVKGEDIWRLDKALLQSGYENKTPPLRSKRHARWARHMSYVKSRTMIQAHPRLAELPRLDPWAKAAPVAIASANTFILGSEDFLLHLCTHLGYHIQAGNVSPIWWYDIVELLKHYQGDVNWEYVMQTARENRVEEIIYGILYEISEWTDGYIPTDVLEKLEGSDTGSRKPDDSFLYLSDIPTARNKIHHILRATIPSRGFIIHEYSVKRPGLVYFYYPIHLYAIAGKIGRTIRNLWKTKVRS